MLHAKMQDASMASDIESPRDPARESSQTGI